MTEPRPDFSRETPNERRARRRQGLPQIEGYEYFIDDDGREHVMPGLQARSLRSSQMWAKRRAAKRAAAAASGADASRDQGQNCTCSNCTFENLMGRMWRAQPESKP